MSRLVPKVPKVPNVPGATRRAAYSASTKRALIDVAEELFSEDGYAATSLDAIVAGARAVSVVQQCSDQGRVWRTLDACGGRSYPIKAVVGWDTLDDGVTPVVPGLDLRADGYFLSPTPAPPTPLAPCPPPASRWAAWLSTW